MPKPNNILDLFVCKKCGFTKIEEVEDSVVKRSILSYLGDNGDLDYQEVDFEKGQVECYQCQRCDAVITDAEGFNISSPDDLALWILDGCEWYDEDFEEKEDDKEDQEQTNTVVGY